MSKSIAVSKFKKNDPLKSSNNVVSNQLRDSILLKISIIKSKSLALNINPFKFFVCVGTGSVLRLIAANILSIIFITRNCSSKISSILIRAAKVKNIPVIILPKSTIEINKLVGLKNAHVFALRNNLKSSDIDNFKILNCENIDKNELNSVYAYADELIDFSLDIATQNNKK
jgi:ribosomal protein L30E